MKLLVLCLLIMLVPSICLANFLDNQTDKLADKIINALEKVGEWALQKVISVLWFLTQILMIFTVGWLLSFLCDDKDSRTAIKLLIVFCIISLTIDKLISLKPY